MKKLLFIITVISLSSCRSYYLNKYCKPETTTQDSTVYVLKIKDSTVQKDSVVIIQATQSAIYLPSPCDTNGKLKPGKYTTGQGGNKTELLVSDSGITVQSNCEGQVSHWKEKYKESTDSLSRYRETTSKTVVEKKADLSLFQKIRLATGFFWWIGLAGILYAIYKIVRNFYPVKLPV